MEFSFFRAELIRNVSAVVCRRDETDGHLFEYPCGHLVTAVEDNVELLGFLHLFEQRFGVLGVCGELSDLQADVVSGWSFNELLQADETCGDTTAER